jgi:site-specific recombinase
MNKHQINLLSNKKNISGLYICILGILVFISGFLAGYNQGMEQNQVEIEQWMNTHEKYRLIIEKIWEDVDQDLKRKYGNP